MYKYYTIVAISFSFFSCGSHIRYLGEASAPTNKVDVFVDASAIRRSYRIIGKGYIEAVLRYNIETVQKKATTLAKQKGADAVLFQDYFVTDDQRTVYNISKTDSAGRSPRAVQSAAANPVVSSTQNILFLKYD